jgi:hypothetical protein
MNNILKGTVTCIVALFIQAGGSMLLDRTEVGGMLVIITFILGIVFTFIEKYRPIGIGLLCSFVIDILWLIIVFNNFSR